MRTDATVHPAAVIAVEAEHLIAGRIPALFQMAVKVVSTPVLSFAHRQPMSVPILLDMIQR